MAALTEPRNTPEAMGRNRQGPAAAGVTIHAGAMIGRNIAGALAPMVGGAGFIGVGRAERSVDNQNGAVGAVRVEYVPGVFRYENSGGADEIAEAEIGTLVYAVDDQTVARTSATGTRSPAGIVERIDELGVWVRFDEALTRAATA